MSVEPSLDDLDSEQGLLTEALIFGLLNLSMLSVSLAVATPESFLHLMERSILLIESILYNVGALNETLLE